MRPLYAAPYMAVRNPVGGFARSSFRTGYQTNSRFPIPRIPGDRLNRDATHQAFPG